MFLPWKKPIGHPLRRFFCHRVIPLPASLPTSSPPPHQSRDDPLCPRQSRSQSSPSPRLLRLLPWIVPINGSSTSRVRARHHIRRSRRQLPFPASMLFSDASSHTGAARSPPACPSPRSTIVTLLDWIQVVKPSRGVRGCDQGRRGREQGPSRKQSERAGWRERVRDPFFY